MNRNRNRRFKGSPVQFKEDQAVEDETFRIDVNVTRYKKRQIWAFIIYKIKIKEVEEETLESDEEVDDQPKIPTEKIGTKKARKLEEKEARAMQRKIEEEERQKAKELREEKHAERMKRLEEEGIKFYVFPKQINKKFFVKKYKFTLTLYEFLFKS